MSTSRPVGCIALASRVSVMHVGVPHRSLRPVVTLRERMDYHDLPSSSSSSIRALMVPRRPKQDTTASADDREEHQPDSHPDRTCVSWGATAGRSRSRTSTRRRHKQQESCLPWLPEADKHKSNISAQPRSFQPPSPSSFPFPSLCSPILF